ncbi:M20/M25/M40 family metallo-hydrolase [Planobispora siamensis]|uniref:Peptidase n=1 Tax=Planobispora siamensis TaxID=936338 RepID=A0A8J3SJL3_9ACTN|nr:M20/M25/M40 family metallo-hydrolase [Planobispora siamensis]GIH94137.1 peptidase [Planobispora siamensis]
MIHPAASPVRAFLDDHSDRFLDELAAWVRIPSVSAVAEHEADLVRSARWLAACLSESGFPRVEELDAGGPPAVFAHWPCEDPGAPTVLVYSHHDVRAVKDEEWEETSPFEPVRRLGHVYGRGTSDAKGQLLCHVWALRAHLAVTGRRCPAVDLKLLVEGEEEIGSPHLADLLKQHAELLAADVVILTDTMTWSVQEAAVCTAVRGMVSAHLEVRGPLRDVHSGLVSGAAPNPLTELCRLIGRLHDEHGRITLPGFYDTVTRPTDEQRARLAEIPFDPDDWIRRTQTRAICGEEGYSVLERVWMRPSVEVDALIGGDPEGTSRGVIPAVASADLIFHTVPGQRVEQVEQQLRQWVTDHIGDHVDYELTFSPTNSEPYATPPDHPALAVLEQALARTVNRPAHRMRNGGNAPAELLSQTLDAPVLFFGTGLPEDHWHDSDEKADVQALLNGAETLAHLLADLPRAMEDDGGDPPG